jgi:hypothetical protein
MKGGSMQGGNSSSRGSSSDAKSADDADSSNRDLTDDEERTQLPPSAKPDQKKSSSTVYPIFGKGQNTQAWTCLLSSGTDPRSLFANKMLPAFYEAHGRQDVGDFPVLFGKESKLRYDDQLVIAKAKRALASITDDSNGSRQLNKVLNFWKKEYETRALLAKDDLNGWSPNHTAAHVSSQLQVLTSSAWSYASPQVSSPS